MDSVIRRVAVERNGVRDTVAVVNNEDDFSS